MINIVCSWLTVSIYNQPLHAQCQLNSPMWQQCYAQSAALKSHLLDVSACSKNQQLGHFLKTESKLNFGLPHTPTLSRIIISQALKWVHTINMIQKCIVCIDAVLQPEKYGSSVAKIIMERNMSNFSRIWVRKKADKIKNILGFNVPANVWHASILTLSNAFYYVNIWQSTHTS